MREDRTDVIVPALQIYINVMRWAGIEIYVPKSVSPMVLSKAFTKSSKLRASQE